MKGTYLSIMLSDCDSEPGDAGLIKELLGGRIGGGEPCTSEYIGTRALMVAVLEDGLRCFLASNKGAREEAELWMARRRDNWPFSFTTVCHTLGLDPVAVRRAAYAMREKNLSPRRALGRSRPNARRHHRILVPQRRTAAKSDPGARQPLDDRGR